jgi:hypothetical protein
MTAKKSRTRTTAARPSTVSADRKTHTPEKPPVIQEARAFVRKHLPKGYAEFMNWGVINWGIPLDEFPDTYNGQPLCYVGLGAKKNYNSLYLMGVYGAADGKYTTPFSQKLLVDAFKKAGKRLDMGKCCLHFKELDDLELTSVATDIAMPIPLSLTDSDSVSPSTTHARSI